MDETAEPRKLGLDVRFDARPIEGRVYDRDEGGIDRRFMGWLGLMSAIEAARAPRTAGAMDHESGSR